MRSTTSGRGPGRALVQRAPEGLIQLTEPSACRSTIHLPSCNRRCCLRQAPSRPSRSVRPLSRTHQSRWWIWICVRGHSGNRQPWSRRRTCRASRPEPDGRPGRSLWVCHSAFSVTTSSRPSQLRRRTVSGEMLTPLASSPGPSSPNSTSTLVCTTTQARGAHVRPGPPRPPTTSDLTTQTFERSRAQAAGSGRSSG